MCTAEAGKCFLGIGAVGERAEERGDVRPGRPPQRAVLLRDAGEPMTGRAAGVGDRSLDARVVRFVEDTSACLEEEEEVVVGEAWQRRRPWRFARRRRAGRGRREVVDVGEIDVLHSGVGECVGQASRDPGLVDDERELRRPGRGVQQPSDAPCG
jgi:hypothetical protein